MLEWQINSCSRKSDLSGEAFADGDPLTCLLVVESGGDLQRVTLARHEEWPPRASRPIARWSRIFRQDESRREEVLETVQETSELFFALLENETDAATGDESVEEAETAREALIHLLALFLERKRVLRPVGRISTDGVQVYRHPPSGRTLSVTVRDISPAIVERYRSQIDHLLGASRA